MGFGINERTKTREHLFGIQGDKTRVGGDKTPHKRLGGELGILIALESMESLDTDLGGRGDLLDSDAAFFAFLAQVLA